MFVLFVASFLETIAYVTIAAVFYFISENISSFASDIYSNRNVRIVNVDAKHLALLEDDCTDDPSDLRRLDGKRLI